MLHHHYAVVVFICWENPRRSEMNVSRPSQILLTNEKISPFVWDGHRQIWRIRERLYFPDASQISAMVGDHSRHDGFRSYNPLNCLAPVPLSHIHMRSSGDCALPRQNLGQSGNGKFPDRREFSRHMKTSRGPFLERPGNFSGPKRKF